jgi:hypothetical protein
MSDARVLAARSPDTVVVVDDGNAAAAVEVVVEGSAVGGSIA